jgi:hypothetical protein
MLPEFSGSANQKRGKIRPRGVKYVVLSLRRQLRCQAKTCYEKKYFHYLLFFFFNSCILWCYLSKPLTSLSCSLNALFLCLKMREHLCLRYCKKLTHFIISIAVLENVPPDAGFQKTATLSTLNVGLARTGNQIRATCVANSGTNRSAIHNASW